MVTKAGLADSVEMLSFLRFVVEMCMLILGSLAADVSATREWPPSPGELLKVV